MEVKKSPFHKLMETPEVKVVSFYPTLAYSEMALVVLWYILFALTDISMYVIYCIYALGLAIYLWQYYATKKLRYEAEAEYLQGRASLKGSRYSFKNPLTYTIRKM